MSFCSSKLAFKILNDNKLVDYLSLNFENPLRKLRIYESDLYSMNPRKHKKYFATKVGKHVKEMPIKVRQSDEMYQFVKETKKYYLDKAFLEIWDENHTVNYTELVDSTVSNDGFLESWVT